MYHQATASQRTEKAHIVGALKPSHNAKSQSNHTPGGPMLTNSSSKIPTEYNHHMEKPRL